MITSDGKKSLYLHSFYMCFPAKQKKVLVNHHYAIGRKCGLQLKSANERVKLHLTNLNKVKLHGQIHYCIELLRILKELAKV